MPTISAREAAFHALLTAMRDEGFIADSLHRWQMESSPSSQDFQLAQQIAYGACRMRLALDEIARQLSGRPTLQIKRREKALLHTALTQCFYMDRIPLYAVVNETVAIAKRHCNKTFAGFLNALLRNVERKEVKLPNTDDSIALSIRYSFPQFLVEQFIDEFGLTTAKNIMDALNAPGITMARCRSASPTLPLIENAPLPMVRVEDTSLITKSNEYYIQNATPASLMHHLSQGMAPPHRILDLCAAPGGKLIAAHDIFPAAELSANDITENKIVRLRENLDKYGISATISCAPGEQFKSPLQYSLIIVDAPCSNSGVLNKRPEARWRLTKDALLQQAQQQKALLEHAVTLLEPGGEIWYMTCSILDEENESLINSIKNKLCVTVRTQKTLIPNVNGWDGGYGCALSKST